jgi:GMP synthase (glutamine-hydrolysing)
MRPIGILVTGEPIAETRHARGGFDALIRGATGAAWSGAWEVIDCTSEPLPSSERFAAFIVTGSPASVTERRPWMLALERWLRAAVRADCPVLGICFGHQILAQALGGRVEHNPTGREFGTVQLELLADDPLLGSPSASPFPVNMAHQDSVVEVPSGTRVLARTLQEPRAAIRWGPRAWGVQFHPEFDAEVTRYHIRHTRASLAREGADPERLDREVGDAVNGRAVLVRFVASIGR